MEPVVRRLLLALGLAMGVGCVDAGGPGGSLRLSIVPIFARPVFELRSGDLNEIVIQVMGLPAAPGGAVVEDTVPVDTAGDASAIVAVPLFSANEQFAVLVQGVRSSDRVVLYSGTDTVTVTGRGTTTIAAVHVNYVGPCQPGSGCTLALVPQDTVVIPGASFLIRAMVDSEGIATPGVPIELTNLSPALVSVTAGRLLTALPAATTGEVARVAAGIEDGAVDTLEVSVSGVGVPAKLAFVAQAGTAVAGAALSLVQVAVEDAAGNLMTTATNSVTVAIGANPAGVTGALLGTTTVAAVGGVATFSTLTLNTSGTGYALTASAAGLLSATSTPLTVTAGVAAKLAFVAQAGTAVAGAALSLVQVAVEDALGNTVTTATPNITVAIGTDPAGGILSGTTTVAAAGGVATFSTLSLNVAATGYTLSVSATGLTGATSSPLTIIAGPAAKLGFVVQPSIAVAGAAITPLEVAVEDALGNTVTTATTNITVAIATNPVGGILSGTTTVAAVGGVSTFSTLSLNVAATGYALSASATSLTGATSAPLTVSAGAPTQLVFIAQPTSGTLLNVTMPAVQVAIEDAEGNLVATATTTVTIALVSNPNLLGTLLGTLSVVAVNGVATFSTLSISLGGIGYLLTATAPGLTGATSSAFNIT